MESKNKINAGVTVKDKDKIIEELRQEDERLNQVIIDLHKDLRKCNRQIKKQSMLINVQWDIINCMMDLKNILEED